MVKNIRSSLINSYDVYWYLGKGYYFGVDMKNASGERITEIHFLTPGDFFIKSATETVFKPHGSVIVSIPEVKDMEQASLSIFPEATSWLAEKGNTLHPAITDVFPLPHGSFQNKLQVRYPYTCEMSFI